MSQIEKLFEKLSRRPTPTDVLFDDIDKLLRAYNFKIRQSSSGSSHYTYSHPDLQEIVTIAKRGNKVKAAYVRMAVRVIEKVLELQRGEKE